MIHKLRTDGFRGFISHPIPVSLFSYTNHIQAITPSLTLCLEYIMKNFIRIADNQSVNASRIHFATLLPIVKPDELGYSLCASTGAWKCQNDPNKYFHIGDTMGKAVLTMQSKMTNSYVINYAYTINKHCQILTVVTKNVAVILKNSTCRLLVIELDDGFCYGCVVDLLNNNNWQYQTAKDLGLV